MVKWFFKYGFVVFIFNTFFLSIEATYSIGDNIFIGIMAFYVMLLLMNPHHVKNVLFHKAFSFFLFINFLNLCYFFLFHSFAEIEAVKYLLARGMQFAIISVSIYFHYDYYKTKFLDHVVYLSLICVFIGLIFNVDVFSGRYAGIIWNPNMLSSYTSIGFAILFLKPGKKTILDVFFIVLLLLISLATGSRGVLVAIALVFLFRYGFSIRNVLYAFLGLAIYFIIINLQLDTSINRFASQSLFNDRILQYQYAYQTLLHKPIFGFGLDKYAYIYHEVIPLHLRGHIHGAHNGYLAILTQYGLFFGLLILFVIFQKSIQAIIWFRKSSGSEKIHVFIIVYALLVAIYESLLTGINEFHTNLFWFSLALLSFTIFKKEYEN